MRSKFVRVGVLGAAMALVTAPVFASGFHIYEQGAKASGQGVAFVARADDATAAFYNPAAIAKLDGTHVSFGFSAVLIGDTQVTVAGGQPVYTPGLYDMEENIGLPPHLHVTHKFADSRWAVSGSLTAPFGVKTEWDKNFGGRFSARTTDLQTVVLGLAAAADVGSGWSVSAGLDYIFADVKDFTRNVFLSSIPLSPIPVPDGQGGTINVTPTPILGSLVGEPLTGLEGDGDDIGWNVSAHWKNDDWAFGAIYRNGYSIDIDGEIVFSDQPANLDAMIPVWAGNITTAIPGYPSATQVATAYAAGVNSAVGAGLTNYAASGVLDLPGSWMIGIASIGGERWEVELNFGQILWSDFQEIRIQAAGREDSVINENWGDSTNVRLGASYDWNEHNELRLGIYTDQNPIPDESLRPSIPDNDRLGMTIGWGYQGENWSVDAYWLHIRIEDRTIDISQFVADNSVVPGSYETSIDLLGLTAGYRF
ncbi:MAG: hypothetical protein HC882_01195 [Acidobacteria bacterium]|nr:hypothetical protein [Acidobacteriota bacterium]